jgi:hypothetical protein
VFVSTVKSPLTESVTSVPVVAGKVRVLVPATAGAEIVISPEVSPVSFILE